MKKLIVTMTAIAVMILWWSFDVEAQACSGCKDFTSQSGLSSSARKNLAKQFAPQMRFDRGARTYPMSAKTIYDNSNNRGCNSGNTLGARHGDAHFDADFPQAKSKIRTYYNVKKSGNRYYIAYWWAYWRQPNCFGRSGGHDYDWEHIVVQVQKVGSTYRGVSVTFFQHSGWYTKLFQSGKMSFSNGHPVMYVGKKGHGSYHKGGNCASNECCYFGDCRNSDNAHHYNVWSSGQIWEMTCSSSHFAFPGRWGSTGQGPLYKQRLWSTLAGCKGNASTCVSGDRQQGCNWSNVGSETTLPNIALPSSRILANSEWLEDKDPDELMFGENHGCDCSPIFPSPVTDMLNITQKINPNQKIAIFDHTGRLMLETKGVQEIDVKNLDKGSYILKIDDKKSLKFIKE